MVFGQMLGFSRPGAGAVSGPLLDGVGGVLDAQEGRLQGSIPQHHAKGFESRQDRTEHGTSDTAYIPLVKPA